MLWSTGVPMLHWGKRLPFKTYQSFITTFGAIENDYFQTRKRILLKHLPKRSSDSNFISCCVHRQLGAPCSTTGAVYLILLHVNDRIAWRFWDLLTSVLVWNTYALKKAYVPTPIFKIIKTFSDLYIFLQVWGVRGLGCVEFKSMWVFFFLQGPPGVSAVVQQSGEVW